MSSDVARQIDGAVARSKAVAEIAIGEGILGSVADLVRRHLGEGPVVVVADENTFAAAGGVVAKVLANAGMSVASHVLAKSPRPKPSVDLAESVAEAVGEAHAVAVGSGVINDLTKYAAFSRGRPYLCVPTAASMDGYSSSGAPLTRDGFKKTIECAPPRAILADLDVIASAPPAMSAWGYGDLAGKVPAGGDWIIADALGIEPIDEVAWPLVQDNLAGWLAAPEAVRGGDPEAIARLFAGLTLAGLAMEFHGSSRPASGADHQIAHMWEMEGHTHRGERVSHGACVAIGCLTSLALFDFLLAQDLAGLDAERIVASAPSLETKSAEIFALMEGTVAERALAETSGKHASPETHRARLADVACAWPGLKRRLKDHLMRADAMRELLRAAGAPTAPEEIGIDRERLRRTVRAGRFIRSRYTILDLLEECGLLDAALDATIAARSEAA